MGRNDLRCGYRISGLGCGPCLSESLTCFDRCTGVHGTRRALLSARPKPVLPLRSPNLHYSDQRVRWWPRLWAHRRVETPLPGSNRSWSVRSRRGLPSDDLLIEAQRIHQSKIKCAIDHRSKVRSLLLGRGRPPLRMERRPSSLVGA